MENNTAIQLSELHKLMEIKDQLSKMKVSELNNILIDKTADLMVNADLSQMEYAKHIQNEINSLVTVTAPLSAKQISELPIKTIVSYVKAYYVVTKIDWNKNYSDDDAMIDVDFAFYSGFTAEFSEFVTGIMD